MQCLADCPAMQWKGQGTVEEGFKKNPTQHKETSLCDSAKKTQWLNSWLKNKFSNFLSQFINKQKKFDDMYILCALVNVCLLIYC